MRWPLLDALSDEARADLVGRGRVEHHRRRRTIFHEGSRADAIYLIRSGHVAVKSALPSGELGIVVVLGPGDVFGELAVLAPGLRSATVVTLDDTEVLRLGLDAIAEARRANAAVDQALIHTLSLEVRRLTGLLMEAHYLPADERVRRRLDDLAEMFAEPAPSGPGGDPASIIPLTQEELAQVAGTTRATVNRILRAAEAAGQVRITRGGVEVIARIDPGEARPRRLPR